MNAAQSPAVVASPDRCDALVEVLVANLKRRRTSINTARDLDSLHLEVRFRPDGTLRLVRVFLNSEVEYDRDGAIKGR